MKAEAASSLKKIPWDFLYLVAAAVLVMSGIVPAKELMHSMANEATFSFFFLFLVCKAVVSTDSFSILIAKVLSKIQSKKLLIPLFSGVLGGILSPSLKLQKFLPSTLFYPLLIGSSCTLMGSLVGLALNHQLRMKFQTGFSIFEIAMIGLPCLVASSLYALADRTTFWPYDRTLETKKAAFTKKEKAAGIVLILMAVLASLGAPLAWTAAGAALLFLLTKFLPWKTSLEGFSWELLLLVISGFVFSSALSHSSLANTIAYPFALIGAIHPVLLLCALYLATLLLSHFFFPVVAAVLLFPIACEAVQFSGFAAILSPKAAALAIFFAANFSFLREKQEIPGLAFGSGEIVVKDRKKKIGLSILLFLIVIGSITLIEFA